MMPILALTAVIVGLTVLDGWDEFLDVTGLREFEPVDVRELAAEVNINEFFDAIDERDWANACVQLTPEGLVSLGEIVSGRAAPASLDRDRVYQRCEQILKLADERGAFQDLGDVTVDDFRETGSTISVTTYLGTFTLTGDGHEIVAFPPVENRPGP